MCVCQGKEGKCQEKEKKYLSTCIRVRSRSNGYVNDLCVCACACVYVCVKKKKKNVKKMKENVKKKCGAGLRDTSMTCECVRVCQKKK